VIPSLCDGLGGNADVFEVQLTCLWPALSEPKVQLRSFPLVAPGVRMHDHETALGRWTASTRMTICSSSPVNRKHNRSPTAAEPFTIVVHQWAWTINRPDGIESDFDLMAAVLSAPDEARR